MRKLVIGMLAVLVLVFTLVPAAFALDHRNSAHTTVAANETVNDDLLLTGTSALIEGTVDGDVFAFAQTVVVRGTIKGNLIAAGDRVEILGTVQGSLYAAADDVLVEGRVERSMLAAGSDVTVSQKGAVGHTFMGAGDRLGMLGTVGRGMLAAGNRVTVEGQVARELKAAVNDLVIRSSAVVGGPVSYTSDHQATIEQGARTGDVDYRYMDTEWHWDEATWWASGWWIGAKFAGFLLVGLLVLALIPSLRRSFPAMIIAKPWQAPLAGFLTLVALPVALVLLLLTIVGIPFSFLGMLALPAVIYFSQILVAWTAGRLLADYVPAMASWSWPVIFLVGALLTTLLVAIPGIGWLFGAAAVFYGIGGIGYLMFAKGTAA